MVFSGMEESFRTNSSFCALITKKKNEFVRNEFATNKNNEFVRHEFETNCVKKNVKIQKKQKCANIVQKCVINDANSEKKR